MVMRWESKSKLERTQAMSAKAGHDVHLEIGNFNPNVGPGASGRLLVITILFRSETRVTG